MTRSRPLIGFPASDHLFWMNLMYLCSEAYRKHAIIAYHEISNNTFALCSAHWFEGPSLMYMSFFWVLSSVTNPCRLSLGDQRDTFRSRRAFTCDPPFTHLSFICSVVFYIIILHSFTVCSGYPHPVSDNRRSNLHRPRACRDGGSCSR
jgi:hypothetical protein